MLDFIHTCVDAPDRLLIPKAERQAAAQRRRLLAEARQHASRIVAQANEQAGQIRDQALSEGYSQGILHAAGEITQVLLLKQGMAARLHLEVAQSVRLLLQEVLADEAWLEAVLQHWLKDVSVSAYGTLQLLVPQGVAVGQLRQRLAAHWPGNLLIDYHEHSRFVFRHADQLLEFDIPGAVEPLVPRLLRQMSGLRPALRELEEASASYLQAWVADVVGRGHAHVEEVEHAN